MQRDFALEFLSVVLCMHAPPFNILHTSAISTSPVFSSRAQPRPSILLAWACVADFVLP